MERLYFLTQESTQLPGAQLDGHVFYRYYLSSRKEDLALAPQPMSQKWESHALSSQRWLGLQSLTHDTNDANAWKGLAPRTEFKSYRGEPLYESDSSLEY